MANITNANYPITTSSLGEREYNSKSTTPLTSRQSHIVTRGSHEWLIEDFLKRDETTGISLSTRFTTPCIDARGVSHETVWRLKAYPKGCDGDHRDYISIFINQVAGPVVWVKYTISLLGSFDRTPYVHNTRKGAVQFLADRRSSSRGWKKFISLEQITPPQSTLLHDGGLLIRCTVELECRDDRISHSTGVSGNGNILYQNSFGPINANAVAVPFNIAGTDANDISEDPQPESTTLGSSFPSNAIQGPVTNTAQLRSPAIVFDVSSQQFVDSMKYSDLILSVESPGTASSPVDIPCHKFMLAKKSDVFDAMFSHNFQETQSNRVVITDLEPESVLEMVRYIYNHRVQNLDRVGRNLLAAADKYNIPELKEICEKALCESMNVENVSSLLLFARDRNSDNLKRKAIDFITRNIQAVTNSPGWNELVCEPLIMTEVVRAMGPR